MTYPEPLIAAAKALAEKHGSPLCWAWTADAFKQMLCEALLTHPDPAWSEQAMEHPGPWSAFAAAYVTTKPEPTEDHLRRACEELNRGLYTKHWRWAKDAKDNTVRTVARLLAEREAMQARDSKLEQALGILHHRWKNENWPGTATLVKQLRAEMERLASTKPEPTPDPDLVLAREAADAEVPNSALPEWTTAYSAALRALKLAKEQG